MSRIHGTVKLAAETSKIFNMLSNTGLSYSHRLVQRGLSSSNSYYFPQNLLVLRTCYGILAPIYFLRCGFVVS